MTRHSSIPALALACLIGLTAAAVPASAEDIVCTGTRPCPQPPVPSIACPLIRTDQAPTLDGRLDDAVWSRADRQTRFHRHYGGLDRPMTLALLTDGAWLYVGLSGDEPVIPDDRMEIVWISIAPHKSWDQFVSFDVKAAAPGLLRLRPDDPERMRAAFRQHPERWVFEIAIRTADVFGRALDRGKVFDFNLSRTRMGGDEKFDVYHCRIGLKSS